MATYELDAWAVLGDASRRSIIETLSARPSSVTELAHDLPISRPAVSQHLKLLKAAGLVSDRAEGTRRIYSVDAERLARFRNELEDFWGATLTNLREVAAANSTGDARSPAPDRDRTVQQDEDLGGKT